MENGEEWCSLRGLLLHLEGEEKEFSRMRSV